MHCLNVRQPFGYAIVHGLKNREWRTWQTPYRGPLLIRTSDYVGAGQDKYEGARLPPDQVFFAAVIGACSLESIRWMAADQQYAWHLRAPLIFPHPFLQTANRQLFDVPLARVLEYNTKDEIGWLAHWIGQPGF